MKTVMVIYGTRPEAIKVAPLIQELTASPVVRPVAVATGQHREMLDQVNELFGIQPDHDLDLMEPGQSLNRLAARLLAALDPLLEECAPDAVVVQGDTTSVAISALAAFYRNIAVVHLEAGLRSGDLTSPFPEEGNRRVTGELASLHLAPTQGAKNNLLRESFSAHEIAVTGNTVIDALLQVADLEVQWAEEKLGRIVADAHPIVLVTAHRRENLGSPMRDIARSVHRLAVKFSNYQFVVPMHRNPRVREILLPELGALRNVLLTEPLDYLQFAHLQKRARLVLTDSGGVQEEAPSFGVPVLVLRENTERPEAIEAGTVRLVGTHPDKVVPAVVQLLEDAALYEQMARATNPYGDGRASARCLAAITAFLGCGSRVPDFDPVGRAEQVRLVNHSPTRTPVSVSR